MRDLTGWRSRLGWWQRRRDDHGVVGVIVVVLISVGVLTGAGVMVVDVGQLYQNQAEIQSGADSAALAVARSCALSTCSSSLASTYAADNAASGHADVTTVCGSGSLGACSLPTGTLYECPSNPAAGINYVDVAATAETSGGSTLISPSFAKSLPGLSGYSGTTVKACSQTEWGSPSSANVIGFTISACSWYSDTSNGTSFGPTPPFTQSNPAPTLASDPNLDQVLTLGSGGTCTASGAPSGWAGGGEFGWLGATGCGITLSSGTYSGTTGASGANACISTLESDWSNDTVVYLPVYTSSSGSTYTLYGFAAFVITGMSLTAGASRTDWLNANLSCGFKCIDGYFTKAIIPASDASGGLSGSLPDLGASQSYVTG